MSARRTSYGPRSVGALLPDDLARLFRSRGFARAAVLTEWPAIVGAHLAERCCPERLTRDGTLRLRVTGPAAVEIQHLGPQILERVAGFFGYAVVSRLKLVQGPVTREKRPPRRDLRALRPEEEQAIAQHLAGVEDAELRGALDRLGRAVLASRPLER